MPDIFDQLDTKQASVDIFDQVARIAPPKKPGFISGMVESFGLPGTDQPLSAWNPLPGLKHMALHPIDSGALLAKGMADSQQAAIDRAYTLQHSPGAANKIAGLVAGAESAVPIFGPALVQAGEEAQKGNYAHAAGLTAGTGLQLFGGELIPKIAEMKAPLRALPGQVKALIPERPFFPGKQAKVYKGAEGLHPKAIVGAEKFYRAAAPTEANARFRENLYAFTGDLAEIGKKVDLSESKGGIINPDMRPAATVKAIDEHLHEMYKAEREPQIQRNANVPVVKQLGEDAVNGLEYLTSGAGEASGRSLAAKVANSDIVPLGQLNDLAMLVNKELRKFESMTPETQALAQSVNPKIGSLKPLDVDLKSIISTELERRGEPGIKEYERRYAGGSAYRDQLRRRINSAELKRQSINPLPTISKFVFGGGKAGVASASQAATADLASIGRELQSGFKWLKESGMTAKRGIGKGRLAPLPGRGQPGADYPQPNWGVPDYPKPNFNRGRRTPPQGLLTEGARRMPPREGSFVKGIPALDAMQTGGRLLSPGLPESSKMPPVSNVRGSKFKGLFPLEQEKRIERFVKEQEKGRRKPGSGYQWP